MTIKKHGGHRPNTAKISPEQVREIREMYMKVNHIDEICTKFGISRPHAIAIARKKVWKDIN